MSDCRIDDHIRINLAELNETRHHPARLGANYQ